MRQIVGRHGHATSPVGHDALFLEPGDCIRGNGPRFGRHGPVIEVCEVTLEREQMLLAPLVRDRQRRGEEMDPPAGEALPAPVMADGLRSTQQELLARGYQGSLRTLRRLTAQLRHDTAIPAPPPAPAAKKVARWILTPPGKLADARPCRTRQDHCPVRRTRRHRCPAPRVRRDALPPPRRAPGNLGCPSRKPPGQRATQLRQWTSQRLAAVTAGLTLPYCSGAVEGHVNRKDDQKTNVRPGETRPAAQARPARGLTSRQLGQSHFLMATDTHAVGLSLRVLQHVVASAAVWR
jgi:hypothetical protein